MPLAVDIVPVTPFRQNACLLGCETTRAAAVIDPGGDVPRLLEAVAAGGWRVEQILLTHGHLDHAGAARDLAERLQIPVVGPHRDDAFLLETLAEQGTRLGLPDARAVVPDRWLDDGDEVGVGATRLEVLHCPGHTPGHVVFFSRDDQLALVGDVLFKGSIGRSDLPCGNYDQLVAGIRRKLFPLGDDVVFIPGHGDRSTFGWERMCNPFVCDLAVGADDG